MPNWIFYVFAFIIYSWLILLFGYQGFDKTKNSVDFYLANRSLRLLPAVCTFTATWFSSASMLGFTGLVYAYGISTILYSVVAWFAGLSIILLFTKRLRKHEIVTIPEFFHYRYDSKVLQALTAFVLLGCYIYYISMQIRGIGIVISNFLDVPYAIAILFAFVFIIYTTFGRMYSVVKTHSRNIVILSIGTFGIAWLVLGQVGGLHELFLKISNVAGAPLLNSRETSPGAMLDPYSNGQFNLLFYISMFFGWGLGLAANPQYAVRIIAARDNRTAGRMRCLSAVILLLLYFACLGTGLGARILLPSAPFTSSAEVLPYFSKNYMSSFFGRIFLVRLTAAAVPTSNSHPLPIASSPDNDIYRNLFNPHADEEELLSLNRLSIFLGGSLSLLLAVNPPTHLLFFGSFLWGIVAATILMPLLGGLFSHKPGFLSAITSFIGGLLTTLILLIIWHPTEPATTIIHPAMPGVIVSAILYLGFGYFGKKGKRIWPES